MCRAFLGMLLSGLMFVLLASCGGGDTGSAGTNTAGTVNEALPNPVYQLSPQFTLQFGTPVVDEAWAIAQDNSGNLFVAGSVEGAADNLWSRFSDTATIDAGRGGAPIFDNNLYDAFVAKFDSAGAPIWIRHIDVDNGVDDAWDLTLDSDGNVYVAGSDGYPIPFVVKLDTDGNFDWVRHFDEFHSGEALTISINISGYTEYLFVGGYNSGLATNPERTDVQAFVAALTKDGIFLSRIDKPSPDGYAMYTEMVSTAYYVILTGDYSTAASGVDALMDIYEINPTVDIYAPTDVNSHFAGGSIGFDGDDFGNGVAVGGNSADWSIYIAGEMRTTSGDLAGVVGPAGFMANVLRIQPTVMSLYSWVEEIGSEQPDNLLATAVNSNDVVFSTGTTSGALPGSPVPTGRAVLTVAYDQAGGYAYEVLDGNTINDPANDDIGRSVIVDNTDPNSIYVLGVTDGEINTTTNNQGARDIFIAKYTLANL